MLRTMMLAATFAIFSTAAFSATLVPLQGDVSINRGSGYTRVTSPAPVVGGETVMVGLGGSAHIVYDDQCKVPVKVGNVVSITSESPCSKSAALDREGTRMNVGAAPGKSFGKSFQEPEPRHHWLPYALIGAGITVVGLCIGDVICDDSASP